MKETVIFLEILVNMCQIVKRGRNTRNLHHRQGEDPQKLEVCNVTI